MHLDFLAQVSTGSTGASTVHQLVLQVLRWAHFLFGIAWIGHLYYFTFVQGHAETALVAMAGKASRINTYLSVPMLFGMGGRSHFPVAKNWGEQIGWWVGVFAIGFAIAYHVVNQAAGKVGKEFLPDAPPAAPAPPPP